MIQSSSRLWEIISEVNNLKCEFKLLGKDKDIPVIIAQDYFKYPDKVREFFQGGYWWDNNNTEDNVRPGKSFHLAEELYDWFSVPIVKSIAPVFGFSYAKSDNIFGNCFNGNMPLEDIPSAFPHVDVNASIAHPDNAHVAMNLCITESEYPITTGFWSFNNKKSSLDMSHNDRMDLTNFYQDLGKDALTDDATWFQIENYGPWVLEDKCEMVYNSLLAYPTHFFHNPYIKSEWFTKTDRVTISTFINTSPVNLDFQEENIDDISFAWEFFNLDKIHNYHPKRTVVPD